MQEVKVQGSIQDNRIKIKHQNFEFIFKLKTPEMKDQTLRVKSQGSKLCFHFKK